MRRIHILFSAAVLTAALAAPTASAAEPATRYVALGDSLAWGDGASDPATTAYVPLLADYFAGTAHAGAKQMVNLGIGGETTGSFIERQLAPALALINDPTDTRVVTLSIGGNDMLNLINEPTDACVVDFASPTCQALLAQAAAGVQANLPVIIGQLQAALAQDPDEEKLFVLLPYNAFSGTGSPFEPIVAGGLRGADGKFDCGALGNPANAGLDDILGCTALAMNAIPVDSYPYFEGRGLELTHIGEGFNIHPNDDGYALIAKAHRLANQ